MNTYKLNEYVKIVDFFYFTCGSIIETQKKYSQHVCAWIDHTANMIRNLIRWFKERVNWELSIIKYLPPCSPLRICGGCTHNDSDNPCLSSSMCYSIVYMQDIITTNTVNEIRLDEDWNFSKKSWLINV